MHQLYLAEEEKPNKLQIVKRYVTAARVVNNKCSIFTR